MSGLGSFGDSGNATYLRIGMGVDDKGRPRAVIGRRAKQGDKGAVPVFFKEKPVVDADGNQLYRTEHAFLEGKVVNISREHPEYNGKKVDILSLRVEVDGTTYQLQLAKGDDYWLDFALRCDGITDWSKLVRLTPYSIPQENNPKYSNRFLVLSQGGEKIAKKWKMEWLREVPENFTPDPEKPYPFIYDTDEGEWKRGKALNWLDNNPIQRAIDKVEFLNMSKAELDAKDASSVHDVPHGTEDEADPDEIPF